MAAGDDRLTFVQSNLRAVPEEDDDDFGYQDKHKCSRCLKSRKTRLIAIMVAFAMTVPVLLFYFLITVKEPIEPVKNFTCAIQSEFRILCGDGDFNETRCRDLSCCYDFTDEYCYHYLPSKYYYSLPKNADTFSPNISADIFGNDAKPSLQVTVQHLTENKVKIILHNSSNYEPKELQTRSYLVDIHPDDLSVEINRNDGQLLLTTALGPLMVSDNYLEWSFYMGDHLFGLDQWYFTNNETYKKVIYKNRVDHTTIPAFMAYVDGKYHGVVFDIAGPIEFSVLPSRLVSLRVLSGADISFVLVTGPTPKDIQQQLYQFKLPPRWVLGPHICRNGSTDLQSIVEEYIAFNLSNTEIRYATDCLHDNLYYLLHSLNDTEQELLKETLTLVNERSKFIMTVYPQIIINNKSAIYNLAKDSNLLYMDGNGFELKGTHLNQQVAYPYYDADAERLDVWFQELLDLFGAFDTYGYSLKDNWPDEKHFLMERVGEIPYLNQTFLNPMSFTIPWNASMPPAWEPHSKIHNNYGKRQLEMFRRKFGEDHFMLTSSYTTGMGDTVAQVQNMNTSWVNLKKSIQITFTHGLFANPLISIPVCGSTEEYLPEVQNILCSRWYITAATFPVFMVSSDNPKRDHVALPYGHNRNIAVDALKKREMLMPYYYTILSRNELITRPMVYDFPHDNYTHVLDEQYMLGDALLVAQPLLRDIFSMVVYLPVGEGGFYDFFSGEYFEEDVGNVTLSVIVESDWIVFMREGKIVPLQNEEDKASYTLAIALTRSSNETTASGSLFFNEETLIMFANDATVTLSNLNATREDLGCGEDTFDLPTVIAGIKIYGLEENVISIAKEVDLCDIHDDEYEINYFIQDSL